MQQGKCRLVDVSQNEIKTQKRKIRQGSTITNPDKMKSTSSEIKWIWIQGDRFIKTTKSTLPSCREGEVDGKPVSNTQTTIRHHRSISVDKNRVHKKWHLGKKTPKWPHSYITIYSKKVGSTPHLHDWDLPVHHEQNHRSKSNKDI